MSRNFEIQTPARRTLHGTLETANRPGARPTVLICHGFKGFQEWGFFPPLATLLAERGFTTVRFNLAGSGMRPGDQLVTDLAAFRSARPSTDLEDLVWLLGYLPQLAPERIDAERIGLMGHSRGGGLAILASADEVAGAGVKAMVTWSAVATFDRLGEDEKAVWRENGEVMILNARTGQELPLGIEVLDDVEGQTVLLDIEAGAARRDAPWLIVHGEADETVPIAEARRLEAVAHPPAEFLAIPGAGHTFEVGHPFNGPSPQLIQAVNATQIWFRRHLQG